MFGSKRRRAASNPPLNGSNANPSATSAAAQAFLKNQASNASLSSAAAAAALKSRPMTPTSVGDVQTKRMMRRAGSNSSMGSSRSAGSNLSGPVSHRGPPGAQLERRGSSGSMSERTFREPSPNRSQHVPSAADAPPVPAIPKNLNHRRASSLEPPLRITSPPPNRATGRGSSVQATGSTSTPPRRAGQRSSMSNAGELTRPESRGSVNFSYPTRARPMSPITQFELTSDSPLRAPRITAPNNQDLIYDPNTRKFLPAAEIHAIEQRLWSVANAPVKKQKRIAPKQATGQHLADGTVGGRIKGTAVDALEAATKAQAPKEQQRTIKQQKPMSAPERHPPPPPEPTQEVETAPEPEIEPAPTTRAESPAPAPELEPVVTTTAPKRKKKRVTVSESGSEQESTIGSDNDSEKSSQLNPQSTRPIGLVKKPSVVKEDREAEEQEEETYKRASFQSRYPQLGASPKDRNISPSPLPRSHAGRGHGRGQALPATIPAEDSSMTLVEPATPATNGTNGGRLSSVSPTRSAHFSTTPDSLAVIHQPPGRSVSPRKSALKHSPSTRDDSPGALPGSFHGSEISDNSFNSDDFLKPKKKSVRVSFDDESNVVVGHAAPAFATDSPVLQSPQVKKGWFSIGRGKKKDTPVIEDEGDEVMKPRPALPSFGSVRVKKDREPEERPLVMPSESLTESAKPSSAPDKTAGYHIGQSNDHVVGAVISQDYSIKNTANISKSREPLPPEVTSVEGSGYISDDTSSTYSVEKPETTIPDDPDPKPTTTSKPDSVTPDVVESVSNPSPELEAVSDHTNGTVPEIAVLPATPKAEDDPVFEWPSMPGGWGSNVSDSESQEYDEPSKEVVEHRPTDPTPSAIGIAEPVPVEAHEPPVGEIAATSYHHEAIMEETEDSDSSGIYSDAAEDLSDLEGDGFMSLDAVVESPLPKKIEPAHIVTTTSSESPTIKKAKEKAYEKSKLQADEPNSEEGWDRAQQYWSGLTAEKKRMLEAEAREEAAADASEEEEKKPSLKPKKTKKKKVVQTSVQHDEPAPRSDRTYMIAPGSKLGPDGYTPVKTTSMRSSMRAEPASAVPDTHMRKSMRSPAASSGSMRGSMRDTAPSQPRGSLQKKYRPVSLPAQEIVADSAAVNKHLRHMSSGSAPISQKAITPTLRRKNSGDSDSSFKRTRSKPENSRFRGSMRGSTDERNQSPMASSRFSLRSLSPNGSAFRRPFNSQNSPAVPPVSMRPSMRDSNRNSYDSSKDAPSLRLSRTKSPTGSGILGFGRSSAKPAAPKPAPHRRSRFADSDSEEEARPAFRSRFVDSDSEDDEPLRPRAQGGFGRGTMRASAPARAAPTRPAPARPAPIDIRDDDESSDLPDSDDEKYDGKSPKLGSTRISKNLNRQNGNSSNAGNALASGSVRRSGSGRGTISSPAAATASTPTRPGHARRGSFMSNILRRKKADAGSKVRKSDAESPARRDTPLERSKSDRAALYGPTAAASPGRPMSPKLQKRNPMSRENSASWPLAEPPKVNGATTEDDRPFTSDGPDGVKSNGAGRPDLGTRRFTATGLSAVDYTAAGSETPRKKKKFQALRKMFRLDD